MWNTKALNEIEMNFKTNKEVGITEEEAQSRLKHFGENKLADKKKESLFVKFIKTIDGK